MNACQYVGRDASLVSRFVASTEAMYRADLKSARFDSAWAEYLDFHQQQEYYLRAITTERVVTTIPTSRS